MTTDLAGNGNLWIETPHPTSDAPHLTRGGRRTPLQARSRL